jgi:hypothetical protein
MAECTSGKTRPTPMTSESDSFQAFKAAGNACFAKKDYEGALEACLERKILLLGSCLNWIGHLHFKTLPAIGKPRFPRMVSPSY